MSTLDSIAACSGRLVEEKYCLKMVPKETGVDLKIVHMIYEEKQIDADTKMMVPVKLEWLDPTEEILQQALQYNGDTSAFCSEIDPYFRLKLNNSKLYKLFYESTSGHKSIFGSYYNKNDCRRWIFMRNMIALNTRELCYLYNLIHDCIEKNGEDYFDYFIGKHIIKSNGKNRNSRKRLGFSKSKEAVIRHFGYSFLLCYPNEVFDDDIQFLFDVIDQLSSKDFKPNVLIGVLDIKKANPHLKFEDIFRRAAKCYCDNNFIYIRDAVDNLHAQSIAYSKLVKDGLNRKKHAFIMSNKALHCYDEMYKGPEYEAPFNIDGWDIVPIKSGLALGYVNLIANASPQYYLDQALQQGAHFFAGFKNKKVVLIEYKDGCIQSARRNYRDEILSISYAAPSDLNEEVKGE